MRNLGRRVFPSGEYPWARPGVDTTGYRSDMLKVPRGPRGPIGGRDSSMTMPPGPDRSARRSTAWVAEIGSRPLPLAIVAVAILVTTGWRVVDYSSSDPRASLVLSQTILREGTIKLDRYEGIQERYGYAVHSKNGHLYYYFPLGTSLFSTPVVLVGNILGYDMLEDEAEVQRFLVGILAVVLFLQLFATARIYLGPGSSLVFAALFWFGSPLSSTLGAGLWSHDFAVVFAFLAIHLTLRAHEGAAPLRWGLVGLCLFSAYLCRPTLGLLAPALLLLILLFDRRGAFRSAGVLAGLLAAFSAFSWIEFGQPLPDYYLPGRLAGSDFSRALFGHLFSPARGLFVFSPFLLLPLVCPRALRRGFSGRARLAVLFLWPLLHWLAVSRFVGWWGGWCYGPRLMADILPAAYLVFILTWRGLPPRRGLATAFVAVGGAAAIYLNAVQGLYNEYTVLWNTDPDVNEYPAEVFNWEYPPFLHDQHRHELRSLSARRAELLREPIELGRRYDFESANLLFRGFSDPEPEHRWTEGHSAAIEFGLGAVGEGGRSARGRILLRAGSLGRQRIGAALNGTALRTFELRGPVALVELTFDPALLRPRALNSIELELPEAQRGSANDERILSLRLLDVAIE